MFKDCLGKQLTYFLNIFDYIKLVLYVLKILIYLRLIIHVNKHLHKCEVCRWNAS